MSQTTPPGSGAAGPPPPPPPPSAPSAPTERRLLRRSRTDRWLGGVASGFARFLDVDPVLARVAFIVIGVITFPFAVVFYVLCLFLVPADGTPPGQFLDRHAKGLGITAGAVLALAVIGGLNDDWQPDGPPFFLIPLAVVLGLVWFFHWRHRADWRNGPFSPAAFGAPPSPGNVPPARPSAPYPGAPAFAAGPGPTAEQPTAPYAPTAPYVPTPPYGATAKAWADDYASAATAAAMQTAYAPPVTTWTPRERSALGPLTVGAALVTAGVLVGLDRGNVIDVPTVVILAATLAVVGAGLLLGAVVGRSRGLIALGVVLSLATAAAGVIHLPGTGATGSQYWAPKTAAEASQLFEWGAGDAELELSDVVSTTPVSTSVELGVGEIKIRIPRDATVNLHAEVGIGGIDTGVDDTVGGIGREVTTTLEPETPSPAGTTFDLDVTVGIGHVEVTRA